MILDEFELLKKLGEGAFATVWAARRVDAPPNASGDRARKLYAVKHLKAATDPATGQDLLTTAEFRSLRAIPRHPNVLRPVQVARERGQVFLVTEWCESDVLKTLEAAKARGEIGLPESSVAGVGRGLLRALAHCHAHGWAHRDVKPENILIADGAVRLADFGEAAETSAESGDDVSLRETYVGTRWYRAPEQFLPRGVWEKAPGNAHARDVWAAGCVMGECLLGRALFRGAGAGDMLRKIAELVGEDASAPTPRSVRDAWADAAGGDCLPRGPGRFEETFNVQRSTGHCVSNGSGVSNECLALLREMLRVDPARRITAARAAEHPFFAKRAETRVEEEPPRRTAAGSAAGVPGSIPDARGGTKAAARAAALRRLREVSDSSSDDEFDFDEGDAAASAPAPRAAPPSAALDAAVPAEPTAEARAAMAEIRARVASGTETGTETRTETRTETGTEPPPPGIEPPPPSKEADDAAPRVAASLRAARLDDSSSSDDEFDHAPAPTVSAATGGSARAGRRLLG
jgi:protein kinase